MVAYFYGNIVGHGASLQHATCGVYVMEKLSPDFQQKQKPVARLIIVISVVLAWFLVKLIGLFKKKA